MIGDRRRRFNLNSAGVGPSIPADAFTWRLNEPALMNLMTDRPFNAQPEDSWGLVGASGDVANFSIITDTNAPHSPPNVGRIKFPSGFAGGGEPCNTFHGGNFNQLYFCCTHMFSNPWEGHPTLTNKIVHLHCDTTSSNKIFTVGYGSGPNPNPIQPAYGLQALAANYDFNTPGGAGGTAPTGWCLPNQIGHISDQVLRNKWYCWEGHIGLGTVGGADGFVKLWINNVLIVSYVNIPFIVPATGTALFTEIDWAPTWGGGGSNIPSEQYQFMDAYYASGK